VIIIAVLSVMLAWICTKLEYYFDVCRAVSVQLTLSFTNVLSKLDIFAAVM